MLLIGFYIFFGILAFLYEWANGSDWRFAAFIGVAYPVTLALGAIGWVLLGIYTFLRWSFSWLSRLFQKARFALRK